MEGRKIVLRGLGETTFKTEVGKKVLQTFPGVAG